MIVYVVLNNKVVIEWSSWIQKTITLSEKESKYSSVTDLCQEILFIHAIILFMAFVVE